MAVHIFVLLQDLAPLNQGKQCLERATQAARIQFIQTLPKSRVRRNSADAKQIPQIARYRFVLVPKNIVKFKQGRKLQRKHRKPAHQIIGQRIVATRDRVFNLGKTIVNGPKEPLFAQILASSPFHWVGERVEWKWTVQLCLYYTKPSQSNEFRTKIRTKVREKRTEIP